MEDNHSVVVSGLITCLMWGIKSKQRCPMNEKFKLAETYFIPSPLKGDTQFMTKKREKNTECPSHMDNKALLFPDTKWSTNHRNLPVKH